MMVIYLPLKLEFNLTKRFRVKSLKTKMWTHRRALLPKLYVLQKINSILISH